MGKKKKEVGELWKEDMVSGIDVSSVGSNGEGWLGIGYEVWSKECKVWGEWEVCGLKMCEKLNMRRKEVEEKNE